MFKKICVAFLAAAIAAGMFLHGTLFQTENHEFESASLCIYDDAEVSW